MYGDMKNFRLNPSEAIKSKLNYFYKSYNRKSLRTHYMRFDEDDSKLTEELKYLDQTEVEFSEDK